ncbi:MarR family transcriptional regulator [Candidatus Woesearchaeota archaeon]|nr:MarR family transcriptional regulator [Candidatus Woesearchaeota archaeon]
MLSKIITIVNFRILKFLIKRTEPSLSDIARCTKTTKANTFYALKSLLKENIVRKTIKGKTHLYKFNIFHPYSKIIIDMVEEERQSSYNEKLGNIPMIIHSFLATSLKKEYQGCIFFGSSLVDKYKDIDVFILIKNKKKTVALEKKLKFINRKISPIFGSEGEIKIGIKNEDMLYKNIIEGVSFGFDAAKIKYQDLFLKKQDIIERFIIGYREILSCLEFKEREYVKLHLDRGIMDVIYAILNYFDFFPRNDKEAISLFKNSLKESKPKTIKEAFCTIEKYGWILR